MKGIGTWCVAGLFPVCLIGSAAAGVVVWDFPRLGSCHEGLPFSDGRTGVLVWGGGDTVNLTVGRGDLWDHRGGYPWTKEQSYSNIVSLVRANDVPKLKSLFVREVPKNWNPDGNPFTDRYNPYLLPLGRVVLRLPGATLGRGELDTSTGLGKLVLTDGREIGLAMSKTSRLFALRLPPGLDCVPRSVPATDFPVYERKLRGRGFENAVVFDDLVAGTGGFQWKLPADEPVWLSWRSSGGTLTLGTGRGERYASGVDGHRQPLLQGHDAEGLCSVSKVRCK